MKRGGLLCALVALSGCFTESGILHEYCQQNQGDASKMASACDDDSDCCGTISPPWMCDAATHRCVTSGSGTCVAAGESCQSGECCQFPATCDVTSQGRNCCLPLDSRCSSSAECCGNDVVCNAILEKCRPSACIADGATVCIADSECCNGQCLGSTVSRWCASSADACKSQGGACGDDNDCCGALVCESGTCQVTTATGSTGVGSACSSDLECTTGQCLLNSGSGMATCDATDAARGQGGDCSDATDCRGSLRCNLSTQKCVAPQSTGQASCYGTSVVCTKAFECCSGTCSAGTCT